MINRYSIIVLFCMVSSMYVSSQQQLILKRGIESFKTVGDVKNYISKQNHISVALQRIYSETPWWCRCNESDHESNKDSKDLDSSTLITDLIERYGGTHNLKLYISIGDIGELNYESDDESENSD